jgi:hypothetical protein
MVGPDAKNLTIIHTIWMGVFLQKISVDGSNNKKGLQFCALACTSYQQILNIEEHIAHIHQIHIFIEINELIT